MIITLDIETLPCSDPAVIEEITAGVKPPGNLKKEETIAAWWASDGDQAKKDAIAKTSFDGMYGRIACICVAVDDEEPIDFSDDDGRLMLLEFNRLLHDTLNIDLYQSSTTNSAVFCGHNIVGFDLPFIKHRSIIHQVKPHPSLLKAMNAKPWDNCIADTMLMWSSDPQKRRSMDSLCKALGIKGKDGFDGSMVAETWPIDRQKVIDYCKDDVRRTREIYKRLTWA